eukprot:7304811-Alexandrium_andersonii.AAC.1
MSAASMEQRRLHCLESVVPDSPAVVENSLRGGVSVPLFVILKILIDKLSIRSFQWFNIYRWRCWAQAFMIVLALRERLG